MFVPRIVFISCYTQSLLSNPDQLHSAMLPTHPKSRVTCAVKVCCPRVAVRGNTIYVQSVIQ